MNRFSWSEKYRPTRFAEVIGQSRAVAQLKGRISGDARQISPIILEGPSGAGKTTLALVYARAMQCEAPRDGEACEVCHACMLFEADRQPCFHRINSALGGTTADIRELLDEDLAARPHSAAVHVVYFDEADNLTQKAQRALLPPLEADSAYGVYIFSLLDAEALLPTLRARCLTVELAPPPPPEARAYLERMVAAEDLSIDPEALELIARLVPSYRELAIALENLAATAKGAKITASLARSELRKGRVEHIVAYLQAALDGDIDGQTGAMEAVRLTAREKANAALELLTYLKLRHVGPARAAREHPLDLLLEASECQRTIECFAWRAERLDTTVEALFDEVLEFWSFQPLRMDEEVLAAHMARFGDLFLIERPYPDDRTEVAQRLARSRKAAEYGSTSARRAPPRWRTGDRATGADAAEHLSDRQVRELYEAATFLIQRHGITFNAVLTVDHAALGIVDEARAVALVSDLTRELRLRMIDWAEAAASTHAADLHRISLLERPSEGGLVSTVVMHLPGFAAEKARGWIFEKFLPSEFGETAGWDADWLEVTHIGDARGVQAHHWHLMRKLWRGVDPTIVADGVLLTERLNLKRRNLRPSGRVNRRRYSISHGIGPSAQRREAAELGNHLSAYGDHAWDHLFGFWELKVYGERDRERRRRAERTRNWARELAVTGDRISVRKLAFELKLSDQIATKYNEINGKPWK